MTASPKFLCGLARAEIKLNLAGLKKRTYAGRQSSTFNCIARPASPGNRLKIIRLD
jgi:hypothetical protein